jgi:L-ascorbate metabolism protein UlaG (beta-lactamase superfamily)
MAVTGVWAAQGNASAASAGSQAGNNRYSVCWLGNAGWLLRIGLVNILIDPDLEQSRSRKTLDGIPDDCLSKADAVLMTHEHGDHFNIPTARRLIQESDCRFILPASCLRAATQAGIPEKRMIIAQHLKPIVLFGERFTVTPIPAVHGGFSGAVYKRYNAADCGYLVSTMNINLFHPGDSVLLEEHFDLPTIDILMVSPTEHNTNVQQSLTLIEKLNPRYIFPQHRDTYHETDENRFWTHAYYKELAEALDERFKSRYHIVKQGEDFVIMN